MSLLRKEKGEVMLEGTIVMVITMLTLIWILAVGFIYYQRNVLVAVTNDAATKIASSYYNPSSDIIMGYVSLDKVTKRDLYRNFNNNSLFKINEKKAASYIEKKLQQTNFAGTIENVVVDMQLKQDSPLRKHIEITTTCTFNTPFGVALDAFGMNGKVTYKATGRADCTDIIDYISTGDFISYQIKSTENSTKIIKMINSLIKVFNNLYY